MVEVDPVRATAGVAVLLAATLACATGSERQRPISMGDVASGPGTLTAAREFLQGRWVLQSFALSRPGQEPIMLQGTGVMTYDAFGNLQMDVKADEASSDLLRAAGINIPNGVISTQGKTVIDLQNHTLTYLLEGQPSSMWSGGGPLATNRPRHWAVDADILTLTTRDDSGATVSVSRWKKS